ncbi:MAG: plasmid mobilization relaxosome protein MobC [Ruminococcus sp.]|nr:plasmid mobilization relaxosome protein MobC [Ruminococcus sp.]
MRKRNIDKHIWFSYDEATELRRKSEMACMSESSLIRLLIKGYEPKEKPDERFYDVMKELYAIGNNLNQIAVKANAIGLVDAAFIKEEALRWHQFQADIERVFLRPGKSELKWQ